MANAYKRGKQMGEAIVNMVDQLTTPYDRSPSWMLCAKK